MFLLILETGDKGARHIHTLNSIMFLLIPLAYSCNYHCRNALNSIMFLLIPLKDAKAAGEKITLNSIMFLLIQQCEL